MNRNDNIKSTSVHPNSISSLLAASGRKIITWINDVGNASILAYSTIISIFKRPFGLPLILKQFDAIGVNSLSVVLITGVFTGMVTALQAYYQLAELATEGMAGRIISVSVTKELGPVITAFVLAGRIGSAITAELGTMKVTEQIDAMQSMAVSPVKYLVAPRFIACTIMLPILTVFSIICGLIGGYLTVVYLFKMNGAFFINQVRSFLFLNDILIGLVKSMVFGMVIAIIACYKGFSVDTTAGAEGVGNATTGTAVISLILILVANFFLDHLFYEVLGF